MKTSVRGAAPVKTIVFLLIPAMLFGSGFWYYKRAAKNSLLDMKTTARARVEKGDLVVTVLQAGELEAKNSKSITNDTDRQRKITYVVEDGAKVKKGDLILEMDSADLKDDLLRIQADRSRMEADLNQSQQDNEISQVRYETDLNTAKLRLNQAQLDLKKYNEAEFPQMQRQKEIEITLAKEELSQEQNKLEWTKKLYAKGYANREDLNSNELAVTRKKLDLQTRQEELRILTQYTHDRDLKEKKNNVATAQAEVESQMKTNISRLASAKANISSRKTALDLKRKEEDKKIEEIKKMRVVSEYDGQVFYPKFDRWNDTKIEKGSNVYGHMKVLEFPDFSSWQIKTKIPESIIEKVKPGQEAIATIDAISNKTLKARVSTIAAVPDKGWFDTAQKVYAVALDVLTTSPGLKPGMSVMVEIISAQLGNTLKVPLQAVTGQGDKQYVYVVNGPRFEKTEVKTGESNDSYTQILSGLKEKQEVLLYAPVNDETREGLKESPIKKSQKEGEKVTESEEKAPAKEAPKGTGEKVSVSEVKKLVKNEPTAAGGKISEKKP